VGAAVVQDKEGEGGGAGGMGMPAWMTKTKEHAALKKLEGAWDALVMGTPGKATNEMILGGNFLEQRFNAQNPMPFEGRMLLGYDTVDKEWVAIWVDTSSPTFSISRGTEKDGVVTFKTNDPDMTDPDGKRKEGTMTMTWTGETSYKLEMFEGGGAKTMEVTYTRKK
jgi:hypothetical protein